MKPQKNATTRLVGSGTATAPPLLLVFAAAVLLLSAARCAVADAFTGSSTSFPADWCSLQPQPQRPPPAAAAAPRSSWTVTKRRTRTRRQSTHLEGGGGGGRLGAGGGAGTSYNNPRKNSRTRSWRPAAAAGSDTNDDEPPRRRFRRSSAGNDSSSSSNLGEQGERSGADDSSNNRPADSWRPAGGGADERRRRRRPGRPREEPEPNEYSNDGDHGDGDNHHHRHKIHSHYLATCLPGMVDVLQEELRELGGVVEVRASGRSAVAFAVTGLETALTVLLQCRTAHRILELLVDSSDDMGVEPLLRTRGDLYDFVRRSVPVDDLLLLHDNPSDDSNNWMTLSVHVTLNNAQHIPPDINHSHYSALNIKNALVDAARDYSSKSSSSSTVQSARWCRPSVDTTDAVDVPLTAVLRGIPQGDDGEGSDGDGGAHCSLYRCLHAGGSLHHRGYRADAAVHRAALKESTAAGLLRAAGWHERCRETDTDNNNNSSIVLVDPMMGSGTFLVEAAMMAADLAPGLMRIKCGVPFAREPPVVRWNHGDQDARALWNQLLADAAERARAGVRRLRQNGDSGSGVRIAGRDAHGGAVELARRAVRRAGLAPIVEVRQGDCARWQPCPSATRSDRGSSTMGNDDDDDDDDEQTQIMVVTNPPWGVRLDDADTKVAWESLRAFLRDNCPGGRTEAWILSGSKEATHHLGLRRSQMMPLQTGKQTLRWLQYEMRDARSGGRGDDSAVRRHDSNDDFGNNGRVVPRPPSRIRQQQPPTKSHAPRSTNTDEQLPETATRKNRQDRNKPERQKIRKKTQIENEWLI